MFLVYYIAMVTVGASATDWANDGLFGDGWHLFGIGSAAYNEVAEEYGEAAAIVDGYEAYVEENGEPADGKFTYEIEDEETLAVSEETATSRIMRLQRPPFRKSAKSLILPTTAYGYPEFPYSLKALWTRATVPSGSAA